MECPGGMPYFRSQLREDHYSLFRERDSVGLKKLLFSYKSSMVRMDEAETDKTASVFSFRPRGAYRIFLSIRCSRSF